MTTGSSRRWVLAGSIFGVLMGLFVGFYVHRDGAQLARVVMVGLATAVAAGVFFGVAMRSTMGSLLSVGAELPPEERKRAWRAALRGPVPPDPEVHRVAVRIARRHLASATGARFVVSMVMFVLLAGSSVWLAISTERWWQWLLAAFFLAMIGVQVWNRRRWRRRVSVLVDDQTRRV